MNAAIWRSDLHAELVERVPAIERRSPTAWRLDLDGRGDWLSARKEAGWLLLDADAGPVHHGADPWELLSRTAGWRGGVKLALAAPAASLRRRAELLLDGGGQGGFGARLDLLLEELRGAGGRAGPASRPRAPRAEGGDDGQGTPAAPSRSHEIDLVALVEESGWDRCERHGEKVYVDLSPSGLGLSAVVAARAASDDVLVRVDLEVDPAAASPEGRRAAGLLLLRANGELRSVRACATDGGRGAALDVVLAAAPTPAELHHALSALSVASSRLFQETRHLLGDAALARHYLGSQGATQLLRFEEPTPRHEAGGSRHDGVDPTTKGGKR